VKRCVGVRVETSNSHQTHILFVVSLADKLYMPLQSMNPQVIALFLVNFWAILPRCVHDPKFCPVCLIFLQNV
jgi:hypothetical protein